jgi:hypothetical protein
MNVSKAVILALMEPLVSPVMLLSIRSLTIPVKLNAILMSTVRPPPPIIAWIVSQAVFLALMEPHVSPVLLALIRSLTIPVKFNAILMSTVRPPPPIIAWIV